MGDKSGSGGEGAPLDAAKNIVVVRSGIAACDLRLLTKWGGGGWVCFLCAFPRMFLLVSE